jgi:hypothetical protein
MGSAPDLIAIRNVRLLEDPALHTSARRPIGEDVPVLRVEHEGGARPEGRFHETVSAEIFG